MNQLDALKQFTTVVADSAATATVRAISRKRNWPARQSRAVMLRASLIMLI